VHRDQLKAGMLVRTPEGSPHVTTHGMYSNSSMYAHMICGKRYLISRISLIATRDPAIACEKCYEAHLAMTIGQTGSVPLAPKPVAQGLSIRSIYKCAYLRCKLYDKEFSSRSKYEGKCPNCHRRGIWQRGFE